MFQFTTTTIINGNKAVDVQGNNLIDNLGKDVAKFAVKNGVLTVFGTGPFKKGQIQSAYRAKASAGQLEIATLTVPASSGSGDKAYTSNDVLRLEIEVKLNGRVQSDYTNFQGDFSRPTVIDIMAGNSITETAAELAKQLNKLRMQYGYSLVSATSAAGVLTIKGRENGQMIKAKLYKIGELSPTKMMPVITELAKSEVTQSGKPGFGDTNWMLRSVTLQTYENTRPFGTLRDERPIVGATYDQFTIKKVVKSGEDGVWDGDKKSVTTHVFWVISTEANAFEAALKEIFPDVETVVTTGSGQTPESTPDGATGSSDKGLVINGKSTMAKSSNQTLTVENAAAPVDWSINVGGSTGTTVADGKVTASAVAGNPVITATDANGKVGTFKITVA